MALAAQGTPYYGLWGCLLSNTLGGSIKELVNRLYKRLNEKKEKKRREVLPSVFSVT
jgi:hypothetical protein